MLEDPGMSADSFSHTMLAFVICMEDGCQFSEGLEDLRQAPQTCPRCGSALLGTCPKCGMLLRTNLGICTNCGRTLVPPRARPIDPR